MNTKREFVVSNPPVLVVDDDPDWCDIVAHLLGREISVFTANTVSEALILLDQHAFSVVVIDLSLQAWDSDDRSGFALIEAVSSSGIHQATKIIVLSTP